MNKSIGSFVGVRNLNDFLSNLSFEKGVNDNNYEKKLHERLPNGLKKAQYIKSTPEHFHPKGPSIQLQKNCRF